MIQMKIKNNTDRTIKIAPNVSLPPYGEVQLQPDARHLVNRPIFKAYQSDGSIQIIKQGALKDSKEALTASKGKKTDG